jgi:hypothetical protein
MTSTAAEDLAAALTRHGGFDHVWTEIETTVREHLPVIDVATDPDAYPSGSGDDEAVFAA